MIWGSKNRGWRFSSWNFQKATRTNGACHDEIITNRLLSTCWIMKHNDYECYPQNIQDLHLTTWWIKYSTFSRLISTTNKWQQKSRCMIVWTYPVWLIFILLNYKFSGTLTERGIGLGLLTLFLDGIGFDSSSEDESLSIPTAEGPLFTGQR